MLPPAQIRQQTRQSHIHQHRRINAVPLTAYAVASPKKPYKLKPLQLFRRACGTIWYSARTAVAETCRRCCSDSAESAAHHISTVQFAPQAHRASLVGSHQHGGGSEPCNSPCCAALLTQANSSKYERARPPLAAGRESRLTARQR